MYHGTWVAYTCKHASYVHVLYERVMRQTETGGFESGLSAPPYLVLMKDNRTKVNT